MANDKRDILRKAAIAKFEADEGLKPNGNDIIARADRMSMIAFGRGFDSGYAAATAEGIPQADGWVDVTDRLPEAKEGWNHSEQCLVWYQPSLDAVGNYGIAYYHYDPPYRPCEWVDFAHLGRDPIAWQPLPAPYQRKSEGYSK